ncbi:hypothetical protein B0G73_114131 [Paraburkholderia sp. BL25I1N1]|nr:hypothetical protein B0G73_114131 [Paraburkholderia sp. BL25I1N1]
MYGQIEATQFLQSRSRRLRADTLDGARQPCVLGLVAPSEGLVAGDRPSISRGRQRANDRHVGAPEATGLDVLRHDPTGEAGVVESRADPRNGKGPQTAQGELVRTDMVEFGQARRVRPGSDRGLCAECLSENAALTPSGGVGSLSIAPGDGVETGSTTPPDGAIRSIFWILSTPPDGDPLDMPSTHAFGGGVA